MKFSNILLVLNTRRPGQALALRRAVAFARSENAKLSVCEVVDWVVPDIPRNMTDGAGKIVNDKIRANKFDRLKKLVAASGVRDLEISVELLMGRLHAEVARVVVKNRYDLVIKPFAGHRALQFFSGAQEDRELIRSCSCPVWLINVAERDDDSSILAALDMPVESGPETGLNQHIVDVSRSIARAESRPLHFVNAWRLRGEGHLLAQRNPATDLQIDRMKAHEAANRNTWLRDTVAGPSTDTGHFATEESTPKLHILYGHARKVVPDLAEKLGAGLIVVGAAGRSGLSSPVRRNIAETILPRSDCSLLLVRHPEPYPMRALQVG